MFKHKTLFIVGAGASREVDMPVGSILKKQIASLINLQFRDGHNLSNGDPLIRDALGRVLDARGERNINGMLNKAWPMARALETSAESIDNYLYNHSDDEDVVLIGKLGIARAILNAEAGSLLQMPHRSSEYMESPFAPSDRLNDTWLMRLAEILIHHTKRHEVDRLFENVDFITFNYDRVIERFFPHILGAHFGVVPGEIATLMEGRVIHPYGRVGALEGRMMVPYGTKQVPNLRMIADQLRTFDEGVKDESLLDRMRSLFREAHTLVFLGFAFHEQNMELLDPGGTCEVKRLFATTHGLSQTSIGAITSELARMIVVPWGEVQHVYAPVEARQLMAESQRALRN